MSDLTTYRINHERVKRDNLWDEGLFEDAIRDEMLVPDTRLQAIADAWTVYRSVPHEDGLEAIGATYYVKATKLLDALIQEDT